ncbi:MAG: site-specific integrase [Endomicrobium sp.]|jgi:integrase/recombinase XerD|nr:site-specific integrase [Endomicrobium sp.]
MAYLAKKGNRYYICESYQVAELDGKGLPIKDDNNKPVYKNKIRWTPSSKIKKLAEIELGKYEENKDRDRIGLDKKDYSWKQVQDNYMAYSRSTKARTSIALDEQLFNNILEFYPQINSVSDLNLSFCDKFFAWLKDVKHNAPATVKRKGTTLKNIGVKLVEWNVLQVNPLQRLKIPKVTHEREILYWRTPQEAQIVVNKSTGIWKDINMIGLCLGTRISETLNMVWDFIDFKEGKYKVQSVGSFRTKSRKFRTGIMPPELKEYLFKLKIEQSKNKEIRTNRIIAYPDGTLPTMGSASNYLIKFYKRIGYNGYHSHCLRHTFAAFYLARYKDIYGLSKLLGHSSVTITERYYGHLLGHYYDDSMAKFSPFR